MALTQTQVSQLYVSLFGRASEGSGSRYWQNDPSSSDMIVAAGIMLGTDAAKTYFGSTLGDNRQFIEHIYLNTLGKTYAQDQAGIDYWAGQLDSGKSKGLVATELIAAAQAEENAGQAQDRFNNRVAVSNYTADRLPEFSSTETFSGFISGVTHDSATVDTAEAAVDQAAGSDSTVLTVSLTKGSDAVQGSSGNDLILGHDDTYNSTDTISGGDGEDTLSLSFFGAETDAVNVSWVETVELRNADAATNVDAGKWTNVKLLTFAGSAAKTTVSNLKSEVAVRLDSNSNEVIVNYAEDALGTATGSQELQVRDFTAAVSVNTGGSDKITVLNIEAEGESIVALAENDLLTVNISGQGNLSLTSSDPDNPKLVNIATIVASTATGDLVVDMSEVDLTASSAYYTTVFSGFGNDTITASDNDNRINAGDGDDQVYVETNLDKKDVLEGGEGTDLLMVSSQDFEAAAGDEEILAGLSGFEAVGVLDEFAASSVQDISNFDVNTFVVGAGLNGSQEVTGFTSGATVEIRTDAEETDVLIITMPEATKAGSSSDELNIIFNTDLEADDDIRITAFDVQGVNQINVTTADASSTEETDSDKTLPDASDGYELVLQNDGNLDTISVTGTQAFSFSTTATSTLETIVAQSMEGNMNIDFSSAYGGSQGVNLTTGDGADFITGSVYGDIISAGDGEDTVIVTKGEDRVWGGGGGDTFVVSAGGISIVSAYTTILDFSAVSDIETADKITNIAATITPDTSGVDVAAAEASGGSGLTVAAAVVNGVLTLGGADADRINTLDEWIDVAYLAAESGNTVGFEFSGSTYILEEASGGGAADSMVQLAGVTSITALSGTAGSNTVMIA